MELRKQTIGRVKVVAIKNNARQRILNSLQLVEIEFGDAKKE